MVRTVRPDEAEAYKKFRLLRWPQSGGEPVCPKCGFDKAYDLQKRRLFSCKKCRAQFSATTATPFSGRKMSFATLMAGIETIKDQERPPTSAALALTLGCQQRTAWKLRTALREWMKNGHSPLAP